MSCYEEIERIKENIKYFNFKNGGELTRLYLKSDVLLLTCVFEKLIKNQLTNLESIPYFVLVYLVTHGKVF